MASANELGEGDRVLRSGKDGASPSPDFTDVDSEMPLVFDTFKEILDKVLHILNRIKVRAKGDPVILNLVDQLAKKQDEFEEQKRKYLEDLRDMTIADKTALNEKTKRCTLELESVYQGLLAFSGKMFGSVEKRSESEDENEGTGAEMMMKKVTLGGMDEPTAAAEDDEDVEEDESLVIVDYKN